MNRIGRGIKNNKSVDNLNRDKSRDQSRERSRDKRGYNNNNINIQHNATPTFNNNMTDDFTSIWLNSKLRDRRDKRQIK